MIETSGDRKGRGNRAKVEPIAIIGLACRFPSAPDPGALWAILSSGRDVLEQVPQNRYVHVDNPLSAGAQWVEQLRKTRGGFLDNIDRFDAAAFHIAPREARVIDPQQRLLLETAWEALEDAGQDLRRLEGRLVGVYVGLWSCDYQTRLLRQWPNIDIAMTTGGGRYAASGRISFAFGFEGPSVTIDTACSSSLVAVHAACQALRAGECETALAGGANIILDPNITLAYMKAGVLSQDGRCKFGDASADGYVRSEGVGMVLLKTLRQARADNDTIHAIVRSSAVSHSGQGADSLLAPSEVSQLRLFESALAEAGLTPAQLDYIEAHGTGTRVGDGIELRALAAMLQRGRGSGAVRPCLVGSVKTNIGHTEAAAGIAGLIKTVLCLKHRQVPASLNFHVPNPAFRWEDLPIEIPTEMRTIGNDGRPIFAGVNSFGITGTCAHVILEEALPASGQAEGLAAETRAWPAGVLDPDQFAPPPFLCPLSARSPSAVAALADAVATQLRRAPEEVAGVCRSAALRRTHHEIRLCAVGRTAEELATGLAGFASGTPGPAVFTTVDASAPVPRSGWVFSGQGPQWSGMGCRLYETETAFRHALDQIEELIKAETGASILAELNAQGSASRLDRTEIAQPAIFAIQVALAGLLRSWGLQPAMVVGHSVGEIAAAHVAGVLTLADAVRLVCSRGRIAAKSNGLGKMAAVELELGEAVALLRDRGGQLCVSAINGPRSLTISGPAAELEDFCARLTDDGRFARLLDLNYPFHSALLDPLLPEMSAVGRGLPVAVPTTPIYSTVTGTKAEQDDFGPSYWPRNLRETVRFAPAIQAMSAAGCDLFVEISPHPVLSYAIKQVLLAKGAPGDVIGTLRRDADEDLALRRCASAHFVKGLDLVWSTLAPSEGQAVSLPAYPWQRESYWLEETRAEEDPAIRPDMTGLARHPLLQQRLLTLGRGGACYWQSEISLARFPWLADHRVRGRPTFPAAAFMMAGLQAAGELLPGAKLVDVTFHEALFIPATDAVTLQLTLEPDAAGTGGGYRLAVEAAEPGHPERARQHVTARAISAGDELGRAATRAATPAGTVTPSGLFYEAMRLMELDYGPSFQGVESLTVDASTAWAKLQIPEQARTSSHALHPAILDACLQTLVALTPGWRTANALWLPQAIKEIGWRKAHPIEGDLTALAVATSSEGRDIVGDVFLFDQAGDLLLECIGVRLHKVTTDPSIAKLLHEMRWQPCPPPPSDNAATLLDHRLLLEAAAAAGESPDESAEIRRVSEATDRLVTQRVASALRDLGFAFTPARRFTVATVMAEAGIAPRHARFLGRLLEILREDGILRRDGEFLCVTGVEAAEADAPSDAVDTSFWRVFMRATRALPEILAGRTDAVEVLFGGDGAALLEDLYFTNLFWCVPMRQLARTASALSRQLPEGQKLRVLEIGAGTGGLTRHLLPQLERGRTEYVFTDCTSYFLTRARQVITDSEFLSERLLDIERNPLEQSFDAAGFDVVVAANCLHATIDLRQSVRHAAQLLKPGGLLLLQEETARQRWTDLIFGATDGWWRFADTDLRPDHPLLSAEGWKALLREEGFGEVAVLGSEAGAQSGAVAIIARNTHPTKAAATQPGSTASGSSGREAAVEPWLILADRGGAAEMLTDRLRDLGRSCHLIAPFAPGETIPDEPIATYLAATDSAGQAIIDLRALDMVIEDANQPGPLMAAMGECVAHTLDTLKQIIGCARLHPPRLVLVTAGSQTTDRDRRPAAPGQAALWALARTALLENRGAAIQAIDLDSGAGPAAIVDLANELLMNASEPEIALREGVRLARRLHLTDHPDASRCRPPPGPFSLDITRRGALDNVEARSLGRASPAAGEVEIGVAAAGLNFRDVLNLLGVVDEVPLGLECSGVITAVGPGVTDVAVGDAVVAIGFGCWRSHCITPAALTAPRPAALTHAEAAALPMAYLTAHYALRHLVALKPGQRVLIHSAAGGVGLAAVHMALADGAEVLGTAGSPEKRAFVRALGAAHVLNSRDLSFADDIRSAGIGQIDVVLNVFNGDFIPASLDLLAPGGSFIELGKRDIWSHEEVAKRRPDVAYHVVELTQVMRRTPDTLTPMLRRIVLEIAQGALPPLPVRGFPMSEAIAALRFMQAARHTGKIVLVAPQDNATSRLPAAAGVAASGILITGGFSGLGLEVASWLAEAGGMPLVLISRNGPGDVARARIDALRARDVTVFVERCDVGDEADLARLLARCGHDLPPLRGVFHLAGVLDDGALHELDIDRFQTVFRPKALGAWNLHRLTKGMPLEAFVLFSSTSALLGSPGQASHAAANAFIDALAHRRRAAGLPAQSINWGVWLEVGSAARPDRLDNLARQGLGGMTTREALEALGQVMASDAVQVAVMRFDATAWLAGVPVAADVFSSLQERARPEPAASSAQPKATVHSRMRDDLAAAPPGPARRQILEGCIQRRLARILGAGSMKFDTRRNFKALGLDSLTALELRDALERDTELKLPAGLIFNHATIANLATELAARLDMPLDVASPSPAQTEAAEMDELSSLLSALQSLPGDVASSLIDPPPALGER